MQKLVKILIVDDHPMIRDGLKTMLEIGCEDMVFKVFDCDNTEEAVEYLKNEKMKVKKMKKPIKTPKSLFKYSIQVLIGLNTTSPFNFSPNTC